MYAAATACAALSPLESSVAAQHSASAFLTVFFGSLDRHSFVSSNDSEKEKEKERRYYYYYFLSCSQPIISLLFAKSFDDWAADPAVNFALCKAFRKQGDCSYHDGSHLRQCEKELVILLNTLNLAHVRSCLCEGNL
jgi:hypothetical protein